MAADCGRLLALLRSPATPRPRVAEAAQALIDAVATADSGSAKVQDGASGAGTVARDSVVVRAAVRALGRRSAWTEVLSLLRAATRQAEPSAGGAFDVACYVAAIRACGRAGRPALALELLKEMEAPHVAAPQSSKSQLSGVCERTEAAELNDDAHVDSFSADVPAGCAISDNGSTRRPSVLGQGVVVGSSPAASSAGSPAALRQARIAGYGAAIKACAEVGDWGHSLALLDAMHNAGLSPDVAAFSAAIGACERGMQSRCALYLVRRMRKEDVAPDVIAYSAAISACEVSHRWREACGLIGTMKEDMVLPNVVSYSAAISACAKGGRWRRVLEMIAEMRQSFVLPNIVSYSAAINACIKGTTWTTALQLWHERQSDGVRPNTISFSAVICAAGAGGQWSLALALLEQMAQQKVAADVFAYSGALNGCEKGFAWQQGVDLLRDMKKRKVWPDRICTAIGQRCRRAAAEAAAAAAARERIGRKSGGQAQTKLARRLARLDCRGEE